MTHKTKIVELSLVIRDLRKTSQFNSLPDSIAAEDEDKHVKKEKPDNNNDAYPDNWGI